MPAGFGVPMASGPLCCGRHAWDALRRTVPEVETPEGLVRGAVAVAMHQYPQSDAEQTLALLQAMAGEVRRRVRGSQPQALLAHLHDYLFDELGYRGVEEDVYHASNSYLPEVMRRRRGLPIMLSLVYVTLARWVGLSAWGVGLPGHFLAAVMCDGARLVVDPFAAGRVISQEDASAKLRELYGPEAEFTSDLLEPVSHRMWLTRVMQNLLRTFGSAGQFADVGAMLEMEMLLWPKQDRLQRDLALVLARLGMSGPAGEWLSNYLRNNPDDPQKQDLERFLGALRA